MQAEADRSTFGENAFKLDCPHEIAELSNQCSMSEIACA
jgi:hypothetical protein